MGNSQHTASDSIRKESLGDSSGDGELQARLQTDEHALVKGTENVFFNGPVEDLVPDWPLDEHLPDKAADEDDNLDQIRRYDESSNRQNTEWTNKSYPSLEKQPSFALANDRTEVALSRIESLSVDLLSIILSHLSLLEVSDVSVVSKALYRVCRSNELWRRKFVMRWNVRDVDCGEKWHDWFTSYRRAYANTHDLWIRHWNIVPPRDGISPGRCVIPLVGTVDRRRNETTTTAQASGGTDQVTDWSRLCPSCRYNECRKGASSIPQLVEEMESALEQHLTSERAKTQRSSTDSGNDTGNSDENHNNALVSVEERLAATAGHNHNHNPTVGKSRAAAIYASTRYSAAKWCTNVKDIRASSASAVNENAHPACRCRRAERAFAQVSTFGRKLETEQYASNALCFLKDTLFLSATGDSDRIDGNPDPDDLDHTVEDLYGDVDATATDRTNNPIDYTSPGGVGTVLHLGPHHETTRHTWHIVCLTNPDYVRPITFRVFVQRPDCFTVYPAQGYIEPGETVHLVLGVRLLGGLANEAFESMNVQREAVDPTLANVYRNEANLPYAPFAVRYMFCPVVPCVPPLFTSRGGIKQSFRPALPQQTAATSKYKDIVAYMWENVGAETMIRTLVLSAHVQSRYSYEHLARETLQPFQLPLSGEWGRHDNSDATGSPSPKPPLFYVAPQLAHNFPDVMEAQIESTKIEMELSDRGRAFRTEQKCLLCRQDWGPQAEEFGRRYVLQLLESEGRQRRDTSRMQALVRLVRKAVVAVSENTKNKTQQPMADFESTGSMYRLLAVLYDRVQSKRAVPYLSNAQQEVLVQLEVIIDKLLRSLKRRQTTYEPWREAGVYRDSTAITARQDHAGVHDDTEEDSDSENKSTPQPSAILPAVSSGWKSAPEFLDEFRNNQCSPGMYFLGDQHDPNHPVGKYKDAKSNDVFMGDLNLAAKVALAVLQDPRSLINHGVYDRIPSVGTVVRRPAMPSPFFSRFGQRNATRLVPRTKQPLTKRIALNDPDPDGLVLFDLNGHWFFKSSLTDFVQNIPPPGVGRYPFTMNDSNSSSSTGSEDLIPINVSDGMIRDDTDDSDEDEDGDNGGNNTNGTAGLSSRRNNRQARSREAQAAANNDRFNPLIIPGRGPRLFNLFWLMSSQLGWSINESHGGSPVHVDRRVLIAAQWVANALMTFPLLYTLLARAFGSITPKPLDYHLDGLPFHIEDNEMRYLTPEECAWSAMLLLAVFLAMGRYSERMLGRTYERSLLEHMSVPRRIGFLPRMLRRLSHRYQQRWDRLCPIWLQWMTFRSVWNHRTKEAVDAHIAAWRIQDHRENRSVFRSKDGRGVMTFGESEKDGGPPVGISEVSSPRKLLTGIIVSLSSFCTTSPHFMLNLLTVLSCSIGLVSERFPVSSLPVTPCCTQSFFVFMDVDSHTLYPVVGILSCFPPTPPLYTYSLSHTHTHLINKQ